MPAPKTRSKDPVQQKLRDHKRQWNSVYKDFSQKLKAGKDGLNGRGNARAGLPPSNLKEHLPGEIGSFLSQLAGEFQALIGDAESIISEQAQYASTRRRKKPKTPGPVQPTNNAPPSAAPQPPEQDKIVDTLSQIAVVDHELVAEGSSKLSRFWQYATALFSGLSKKEYNRQRVGLLSQAADMYYSLIDLENGVLTVSLNNVPNTISKYKKFKYNFDSFVGTFRGVEAMIERAAAEKGVEKPAEEQPKEEIAEQPNVVKDAPPPPAQEAEHHESPPSDLVSIKNDMHLLFNAGLAKQGVLDLNQMFTEYEQEEDEHLKSMWEDRIKEHYNSLTHHLANEVQKKYGPTNVRSIQDVIDLVRKNKQAETIGEYMIKTSHNSLTRSLKRQLVKMRTSNKTAPVRLQIDAVIDDMKKTIMTIMNNLEKNLSIEELNVHLEKLAEEKDNLKRPLHVLNVFFMKDFFEKKEKRKTKQPGKNVMPELTGDEEMMDYVMKRKLKRELSEDLG